MYLRATTYTVILKIFLVVAKFYIDRKFSSNCNSLQYTALFTTNQTVASFYKTFTYYDSFCIQGGQYR